MNPIDLSATDITWVLELTRRCLLVLFGSGRRPSLKTRGGEAPRTSSHFVNVPRELMRRKSLASGRQTGGAERGCDNNKTHAERFVDFKSKYDFSVETMSNQRLCAASVVLAPPCQATICLQVCLSSLFAP